MGEPLDPSTRPSRLHPLAQALVVLLLLISFASGAMVWWGQTIQLQQSEAPAWLHGCLVVHGCLNPFLCGLFGYLSYQHFRTGWQLRANLVMGFLLEGLFLGLILSGVGLYYAGGEDWRNRLILIHRTLGILLPLGLVGHWVAASRWVKKVAK